MVNPSHLHGEVSAIIEKFNQLTYHPYIEKYIPGVGIDEEKCRLFYAALSKKATKEDAFVVTLCALLVQAALDVHEQVSLHPIHSDDTRKNRQLHVLIGDYYSSLYYNLLAEADHVPLTRIFSYTLQEINEQKMDVYEASEASYEEIAARLTFIQSGLYGKLLEEFELSQYKEVFESLFFYARYMDEWNNWTNGQGSLLMKTIASTDKTVDEQEAFTRKQDSLLTDLHLLMEKHVDLREHIERFLTDSIGPTPIGSTKRKVR